MTDSDDLRGDPNHNPTRRHHPELRELDNLRALLRPRTLVEGSTPTEALRGILVELEDMRTREGRRRPLDEEAALAQLVELSRRIDEMKHALATGANRHEGLPASLPASLEAIQESLPPKLDEECHVRVGRPRFLTVDQKMKVWLIEPSALPGYMISGRNEHWQWNCDAHSTCVAGYRSATEAIAGARENSKATQSRVGLERWMKVCEAFGFDPEEDPPVSIPAILAGDQWTNSRRMLADACAKLQAPSLEVVLGELVQALSRAHRAEASSGKGLADCAATARAARAALSTLGWSGDGDPEAWATAAAAEREKFISTLITGHDEARKFKSELEAALRSVGVTDYQRDIINRIRLVVAQAGVVVVHKPDPLATMPPPEAQDLLNKLRDVLSVPDGQSIMDHARHAAKGMQALAILGWQSGSPIEWATARAAADAELRCAFAAAQLVGTDHAAMVRELWGNLRSLSERAKVRAHEHDATVRELGLLRSMNAELCTAMDGWRKWAIGKDIDITDSLTSDEIRTILDMHEQESRRLTDERIDGLQAMLAEREEEIERLQSLLKNCNAHIQSMAGLANVLRNLKRQLIALNDLSP